MHVDSIVRPITVVSAADEALDMTHAERIAYAESRSPDLIKELPGQRAVRFSCRALSASEAVEVASKSTPEHKALFAFMFGVVEIEDANASGPNVGTRVVPTRVVDRNRPKVWQAEELDGIVEAFGVETIYEIGSYVYERAMLRKKKGSTDRHARRPFTVLQSLLDELRWIAPPAAALPTATLAATSDTSPSSDPSASS